MSAIAFHSNGHPSTIDPMADLIARLRPQRTDDTPMTGYWSPSNLVGTNMVKTTDYEYGGGGVGDGDLTKVTQHPGGGAADQVTRTWFDWRDRAVATKGGVQATESTSTNRPLVVSTYDNLNEVTETQQYDGGTLTPTISAGVLSLPGGATASLRAHLPLLHSA